MFTKLVNSIFSFNVNRKAYIPPLSLNIIATILFIAGFLEISIPLIILSIIFFIIGLKINCYFSFLILLIPILIIIKYYTFSYIKDKYINYNTQIKNVISTGLVIEYNGTKILLNTKWELNIGDEINIYGKITEVKSSTNFDAKKYLLTKRITSEIKNPKIRLIHKSTSLSTKLYSFINDSNKKYSDYTNLLLLGKKTINNKEIYKSLIQLNIIHLFVISGLHISLFFIIFKALLKLIKINNKYSTLISFIPLLIYLFFLNFPIASTRAFIFTILLSLNKNVFKNKFASFDLLSLTSILFLFYNPYYVYSFSYIFTFLATSLILLVNRSNWSKKTKIFILPFFIYFGTLPITIKLNNFISPLGIIWEIILAPIILIVYSITLFLFPFKDIMINIYLSLELILLFFKKLNFLIEIKNINHNLLVLYYYSYWLIPLNYHIWSIPNLLFLPLLITFITI